MGPMIHLSPDDLGPSMEEEWSGCKCMKCGSKDGGCKVKVHYTVLMLFAGLCGNCRPTETKVAKRAKTERETWAAAHVMSPKPVAENVTTAKPK
jgi:hypothetical protein